MDQGDAIYIKKRLYNLYHGMSFLKMGYCMEVFKQWLKRYRYEWNWYRNKDQCSS